MKIPVTMCHGIRPTPGGGNTPHPLSAQHFDALMRIAADMGFQSINYDQLAAWRNGNGTLPKHPIMIDFDHPVTSMRHGVYEVLEKHGFKGNLFIYTAPYDPKNHRPLSFTQTPEHMTWAEIKELKRPAGTSAPTPSAIPTSPTSPPRTRTAPSSGTSSTSASR
ncbi:MAG: hypothetical protein FJ320_09615 [SAR202 cluster bacterium]|nr:hypothetical protein [SAR202 cluster bacterium]